MSDKPWPRRQCVLNLKAHADDRAEMAAALRRLADDVENDGLVGRFLHAGPNAGYHGDHDVDGSITHESWSEALTERMSQ